MDYFAQQLINGLVLGSIYGLIAIGYTMVYGIVGMINFAHGDIFMIGGFIALISFLILVSFGLTADPPDPADRAAGGDGDHRALRLDGRAHRLPAAAALVPPGADALGDRHVIRADQLLAGRRRARASSRCRRSSPAATPCMRAPAASWCSFPTSRSSWSSPPSCCWRCSPGWCRRTRLGRDMRACEQDQTMAALLGVDVDRTISMTFVIGAALAAVAGMMYLLYYGADRFLHGLRRRHQGVHRRRARRHRLAARRDARRAC